MLICAVTMALTSVCGRGALDSMEFMPLLTVGYIISGAIFFVYALILGDSFALPLKALSLLIFLSLVVTLISLSTPIWALKYVRPASVSVINLVSPFTTAAFAFFLLGQVPTPLTMVGAVIMVLGLWYYVTTEQRESIKVDRKSVV